MEGHLSKQYQTNVIKYKSVYKMSLIYKHAKNNIISY